MCIQSERISKLSRLEKWKARNSRKVENVMDNKGEHESMTDYIKVFKHNTDDLQQKTLIEGALECLDSFGKYFENEDLEGMDACFHFPHYIISGSEVVCWKEAGQLPLMFFEDLKKQGFKRTVVTRREPILVSENKVHFLYSYYREDVNGNVMSEHDNVWIVTCKDGKWGIQVRSY